VFLGGVLSETTVVAEGVTHRRVNGKTGLITQAVVVRWNTTHVNPIMSNRDRFLSELRLVRLAQVPDVLALHLTTAPSTKSHRVIDVARRPIQCRVS
jgi:hypothetical protein